MLGIIVLLTMIWTALFAWAILNTTTNIFSFSNKDKAIARLQKQFGTAKVIKTEKDKEAEDVMFTQLKIGITSFVARFVKIPLITNVLLTPENIKKTDEKLVWAGRPFSFTADQWISVNIFLVLAMGLYTFFLYIIGYMTLLQVGIYIGAMLYLPSWWLKSKIKVRQDQMERELPNIINKLILATMSKAQILTALNLVVKHTDGILSDEIRKTLSVLRLNAGEISNEQAFWDMARRCGTPQVTSFCTAIINSINIKSSIDKILKDQAENMKETRKAKNEEIINKTDTYLMASAALGVMAILILAVGPGFILIMQGFK